MSLNITGFLALGNGEVCPFCLKDSENDVKVDDVFIIGPEKDLLGHMQDKHPKDFSKAIGFDDE